MKQLLLPALAAVCVLQACGAKSTSQPEKVATQPVVAMQVYGDTIDAAGARSVQDLPALLSAKDSVSVKLKARALNSCKMKGCWMNVALPDSQQMRVSFVDYSFFVPKDLAGEEVVIEGTAFKQLTDVATLRHMAEDGGARPAEVDTIQHPRMEYRFIAKGVLLARD